MDRAVSSNHAADDMQPVLPLANRRILITRAPHQASELADSLRALGALPILIPTIEIGPPTSWDALDQTFRSLAAFDITAFTSANAVEAFETRARTLAVAAIPRRIAVVGPATARAVERIGLHADIMPETFTAESLAETLRPEASGKRVLLVLAEDAPSILSDALGAAGATVTVAAAYKNRIPAASREAIASLFGDRSKYPDAVTFTSASTASNLAALLETANLSLPSSVTRASIGPITSRALRSLGMAPHVEAAESTIAGLVNCLAAHFEAVHLNVT